MTSFTGKYEASEVGIEITLDEKTMNEEEGLMVVIHHQGLVVMYRGCLILDTYFGNKSRKIKRSCKRLTYLSASLERST